MHVIYQESQWIVSAREIDEENRENSIGKAKEKSTQNCERAPVEFGTMNEMKKTHTHTQYVRWHTCTICIRCFICVRVCATCTCVTNRLESRNSKYTYRYIAVDFSLNAHERCFCVFFGSFSPEIYLDNSPWLRLGGAPSLIAALWKMVYISSTHYIYNGEICYTVQISFPLYC